MSTYSILAWTLLALLLAPLLLGVSLRAPGLIVLSMTAVLILFSSSTWGQLTVEHTIYSRGTGLFDFSLLNLVLFVAGVGLLLRRMANPWQPQLAPPISVYFLASAACCWPI